MSVSVVSDLFILAAAIAAPPPAQDCRAIADPAARLACYDTRESAPTPPAPVAAPAYAPSAAAPVFAPPAPSVSSASIVRAAPSGRVTTVAPLRYGLFRVTLDDGRVFDTATSTDAPPAAGMAVKLRRSVIGTTFLDMPGRSPITVRLVRQYR